MSHLQRTTERLWSALAIGDEMADLLVMMVESLGEEEEIVVEVIRPLLTEWEMLRDA